MAMRSGGHVVGTSVASLWDQATADTGLLNAPAAQRHLQKATSFVSLDASTRLARRPCHSVLSDFLDTGGVGSSMVTQSTSSRSKASSFLSEMSPSDDLVEESGAPIRPGAARDPDGGVLFEVVSCKKLDLNSNAAGTGVEVGGFDTPLWFLFSIGFGLGFVAGTGLQVKQRIEERQKQKAAEAPPAAAPPGDGQSSDDSDDS
eukprot:TRINITY_DN38056_c0_g1_i1.p1 TRINITY_DN38056_c0_g1~~TRINITY_DN38056_c0_g1_i1.p1  ORF type:complete len:212 (+),score=37.97 TRINITY_DN38056_c0_g1_i1:28-636(+)